MRRSPSSSLCLCAVSTRAVSTLNLSTLILAILMACLLANASPLLAQQTPTLVTQAVDNSVRTVLPGNVHPLARAQFDQGEAPPDLALHRMLLVLKRGPQQEIVLRGLIDDQQDKHSASYHQWLAPEEFGARFGLADSDLAAVTNWLQASGFQVTQVNRGRTVVEFSGTASLVKQYFGTAIHQYAVKGGKYWANAGNPSIPTALTPVVQGFASLNNFPRQAYHTVAAPLTENYHGPDGPLPLFTFGFNGTEFYGVGPSDFATIYNVQPLWNAGIDGTGQTIAIVGETNINIQDIRDFRSIFGLPAKDPQIMVEGPDPGILLDGEETEAIADVSWSGAVAKNATIDFVVSESTETTAGIDLSAIYIIDQNLAPVMSESYGFCEAGLGNSGNAFYSALWEQAAVQGITVLISAGDGGSAGCDNFDTESISQFGLAVSGFASTPFNVAVGGTDFDQTPADAGTYWNTTNNATTGESAKSYIPEMTWNDSCAAFGLAGCTPANSKFFDIVAGSGGPSNCAGEDVNGNCVAGYAKPAWQTGTGVPNDGVRDLPDVSLFAGDGNNGSFYILCQADQVSPCSLNPVSFLSVGGTSLASPAFAGIMSLVNQQTGSRQGNANYALYKLAAGKGNSCNSSTVALTGNSCLFYDITVGNDSVPCSATIYDAGECSSAPTNGYGILVDPNHTGNPAWLTTTGYDMATGLGTVNAANLVNNWSTASFAASTTTLTSLTPVSIVHGANVNVTVTVAAKSSGGTPTGDVSLMGSPNGKPLGIDFANLSGGTATFVTNLLPGGSYSVTAHYEGDQTFGASDSTPGMPVTVTKESSSVVMPGVVVGVDPSGSPVYSNSVVYGTGGFALYNFDGLPAYWLRADVLNSQQQFCTTPALGEVACPTGTITFTDNGNPLDGGTVNLNSFGHTEDQGIQLTAGSHTLGATYNGDASYKSSPTATAAVTVTKATSVISNVQTTSSSVNPGQQFTLTATVNTSFITNTSFGLAPTGTVSFFYAPSSGGSSTQLLGTVQLTPTPGNIGANASIPIPASLAASLTTSIPAAGTYSITATYIGDGNYTAVTAGQSNSVQIVVTSAANFTLSAAPSTLSVQQGSNGTSTITVTPTGGFSGSVSLAASGLPSGVTASFNPTSTSTTSVLTLTASGSATTGGPTTVTVTGTSGSLTATTTIALTVTAPPNFTLSAAPSTLSVAQGSNGTSTITVNPTNGFTGSVSLTASGLPSGVTSSFNPTSTTTTSVLTLTASGSATTGGPTTVTITGKSGSLTQTTTISLTVTPPPNFTLSAAPSTLSVAQGSTGTSTITVTPANGFAGSVSLAAAVPTGVTASFSPTSTSTTSVVTLTVSSSAAVGGPTTVVISGTSGSLTHITTIALTVTPPPNFTLSANPTTLSIAQGVTTGGTSTITVNATNGFTGSVALAVTSTLPSGVTAAFNPTSTSTTSVLTLTATNTATVGGPTTVTITGTSGSLTHTTTIALTITPIPFTIGAIVSVTIATPGNPGTAQVPLTPATGFTGPVTITCTLPAAMMEATCPSVTATTLPATAMVTINTTGPHQVAAIRPAATGMLGFGVLASVFVFAIPGLRRRKAPLALLLFGLMVLIASCGGGGSSTHTDPGTPAGTYTVNLSATGGGATVPATFSVTVQ